MKEIPKISYVDFRRLELQQQIDEACHIKGPHDITYEKFITRYNTRKELAEIEGKTEWDVIKPEFDIIFSQEKNFYKGLNPVLSKQRIFLYSRIVRLEHPDLDPFLASSIAHIEEFDRVNNIWGKLKGEFDKDTSNSDSKHVSENYGDEIRTLRNEGVKLQAKSTQDPALMTLSIGEIQVKLKNQLKKFEVGL